MPMAQKASQEHACHPLGERHVARPASVFDLDTALAAYWSATSSREDTAAYHQILLFGGVDGYPDYGPWRTTIARWLRKLALRIGGPIC